MWTATTLLSPPWFPKAHSILQQDSWYRQCWARPQQLPASAFEISSKDFLTVKVQNPILMVQSNYHCHEGRQGSPRWMISQGHSCLEFIRAGPTYFHSLVPWDRGSWHMDTESPHTYPKSSLKNRTLFIATSHCPAKRIDCPDCRTIWTCV